MPLSERVLLSSCASGPLEQLVFIWLASMAPGQAGIFAWGTILTGVASKLDRGVHGLACHGGTRTARCCSKRDETRVNRKVHPCLTEYRRS